MSRSCVTRIGTQDSPFECGDKTAEFHIRVSWQSSTDQCNDENNFRTNEATYISVFHYSTGRTCIELDQAFYCWHDSKLWREQQSGAWGDDQKQIFIPWKERPQSGTWRCEASNVNLENPCLVICNFTAGAYSLSEDLYKCYQKGLEHPNFYEDQALTEAQKTIVRNFFEKLYPPSPSLPTLSEHSICEP